MAIAISLVARHALKKNADGVRELPLDFAKQLLETAIELHAIQKERAEWWKVWVPFIGGILTVFVTLYLNRHF